MFKLWKRSLLVQIVGSFSLLSLAIVALLGYLAFSQAKTALKESVFNRLTTAASLKEGELNRWLLDRRDRLISLSQVAEVKTHGKILLTQKKSTPEYQSAVATLQTFFSESMGDRANYREIAILSKSGRILVSSNPEKIGAYLPLDQLTDVTPRSDDMAFVSNFYQSRDSQKPTATFSISIFDENEKRLGLLAVHLSLELIDKIIGDNRGLGMTAETYLVANLGNNFSNHNAFISAERFGSEEFPESVESDGISAAMAGNDDRGLYLNYRKVPVIGVYRWLESQDLGLLVEMEQKEAFAPAGQLARSILLVGLSLAGILTVAMLIVGRRIVEPILAISKTARSVGAKVKQNNFSDLETAPILTDNEIGLLAQTFNQMTRRLKRSYSQLQDYSQTLEEKVAARTEELKNKNEELQDTLIELKDTQLQLIQKEKMVSLGQIVAGMAHEINNPVNFIHGNLEHLNDDITNLLDLIALYEEEYPTENQAIDQEKEEIEFDFIKTDLPKILASMKIGTKRIRDIVLSLRNFSRLDEASLKEADLHQGIESTLLILQNRLKATSNRPQIQVIKEYGYLPNITCYPGKLNQMFINILSNAIYELESGSRGEDLDSPKITIRTFLSPDKMATVCIADNGSGMSEETRQKIFDPFFTTKNIGEGTGLGLSISYSIVVDGHGGELSCISSPGKGTEFIIAIPV